MQPLVRAKNKTSAVQMHVWSTVYENNNLGVVPVGISRVGAVWKCLLSGGRNLPFLHKSLIAVKFQGFISGQSEKVPVPPFPD